MSNGKLLIVDDSRIILSQLKSFFERKDYEVFTSSKGEEGLSLLKEYDPDLMILDLHLEAGIHGIDVLKQSLAFKPNLKILIHTGFGQDKDTAEMCLRMGAKAVLSKPSTLDSIKEEIDKLRAS